MYHVATLYGIVIPPGATQVEVRPVFGRGQRRLMYRGPVHRDGVDITEDVIADHVATDAAFWEYVAAQVRTKVLQAPQDGAWQFRLSVCFQDQHGAPATLDPDSGITSRVTAEAWDFWKVDGAPDKSTPTEQALLSVVKETCSLARGALERSMASEQNIATAVKEVLTQVMPSIAEMAKGIALASAQGQHAPFLALVEKQLGHENQRADKATDAVLRMLKERQESGDSLEGLTKMVTLGTAAVGLWNKTKGLAN